MKKIPVILFGFLLATAAARAETLVLKDGKTIKAKILEQTDASVRIDFYGVPITYGRDEIATISQDQIPAAPVKPSAVQEEKVEIIQARAPDGSVEPRGKSGDSGLSDDPGVNSATTTQQYEATRSLYNETKNNTPPVGANPKSSPTPAIKKSNDPSKP